MAITPHRDIPSLLLIILELLGHPLLAAASYALMAIMQDLNCRAAYVIRDRIRRKERSRDDHEHDGSFFCLTFIFHLLLTVLSFTANTLNHEALGMKLNIGTQIVLIWFMWACLAAAVIAAVVLGACAWAIRDTVKNRGSWIRRTWRYVRRGWLWGWVRNVDDETALLDPDEDRMKVEMNLELDEDDCDCEPDILTS